MIGAVIVIIVVIVYAIFLTTKTDSILEFLVRTAIVGFIALIVVTVLSSGGITGFLILLLIFIICISLA